MAKNVADLVFMIRFYEMTKECISDAINGFYGLPVELTFIDSSSEDGNRGYHNAHCIFESGCAERTILRGSFRRPLDEIPSDASEYLCHQLLNRILDEKWPIIDPDIGEYVITRTGNRLEINKRPQAAGMERDNMGKQLSASDSGYHGAHAVEILCDSLIESDGMAISILDEIRRYIEEIEAYEPIKDVFLMYIKCAEEDVRKGRYSDAIKDMNALDKNLKLIFGEKGFGQKEPGSYGTRAAYGIQEASP